MFDYQLLLYSLNESIKYKITNIHYFLLNLELIKLPK